MRNKGFIWVLTILLVLACIYQLSFSWATSGIEKAAKDYGIEKYNSLINSGAEEAVIDNEVVQLYAESTISEKAKLKVQADFEQKYLAVHGEDEAYPVLGISYQKCKDQQLGLGLDLQGGMSVTLEVSISDLVRNLAGNPQNPSFKEPFQAALEDFKRGQSFGDVASDDFIGLFYAHFKAINPSNPSMSYFNSANKDLFKIDWDNDQIIEELKNLSGNAIDKTQRIIESRINKFGVSQPNIQRNPISGRLQIELPGAKDKNRIRKLLQSTASLEFWDGAHQDWTNSFLELDKAVKKRKSDGLDEDLAVDSDFIEISEDSLTLLSDLDKEIYFAEKSIYDSLVVEKELELALLDSTKLQKPLLDGSLYFIHSNNSPYIGVAKSADTAKVNSLLKGAEAKNIFPLKKVKFLWMNKSEEYNFGDQKIDGYALMAVEVPSSGKPKLDGEDIKLAEQSFDQMSNPAVFLLFKSQAANIWEEWTGEKTGKLIAVVLDNQIYSAPYIRTKIAGGNTEISGGFETIEEAQDLANILKAGSLPAPAVIVDEAIVGPSLGQENITSGLWSFVFAFGLVLIYMIFYYNKAGLVANVALIANIFFIVGTLASMGAALTLPGIAGLVLTIGMSVDANVLIYERIREELRKGKGIKLAIQDGYKHAYSAIIDANITSLLTAVVLAYFGSGPIQGFATTLIVGVFTSLFSAIFITRLIFTFMLDSKWNLSFSNKITEGLFSNTSIQFLSKRKLYYAISSLIVIAGITSLFMRGLDGGVEFTGGRTYRVEFSEAPNKKDVVNAIADASLTMDADSMKVFPEIKTVDNSFTLEITTKYLNDYVPAQDAKKTASEMVDDAITTAFAGLGYANTENDNSGDKTFTIKTSRRVDSQISDELVYGSILAIVFSLVIIFIYIAFRFKKWQFGLGALVAMFHDVLVVLGLFSLLYNFVPFSMEIDQAFIAAILTVVGYSINDTVVVFDRIREYTTLHKRADQNEVVNNALNSTLSRTLNTSFSTFLVLLTIFIFGGESIKGFSFALMVGVLVGTYSSVCIATPSVVDLTKSLVQLPSKDK
jgi:SecD/SecF fusion protein